MKRAADTFINYLGANPFSDIQGRNFSDEKIINEFQPISKFWTLFNGQHEVIIGTRGSGKTFLLRMMRRSMLRHINHPDAQKIVSQKRFLSLYVPMHLEFVRLFSNEKINGDRKKELFLLMFNCLLAHSLVMEIQDLLESEANNLEEEIILTAKICSYIDKTWFGGEKSNTYTIGSLIDRINTLFYNIDPNNENWENTPIVFRRNLCSPLLAVKDHLENQFKLLSPTWIICIDEAEFLNDDIQKIINSFFRSDSNNIALKIATLPFYHTTLDTNVPGISIAEGEDFVYSFIDLDHETRDFKDLTNKLCQNRLNNLVAKDEQINDLEGFLGKVGGDNLIDYYKLEFGEDNAMESIIESRIINQFSPARKEGSKTYSDKKQSVLKKYAPILFVRDMYERSREGNSTPGWYAGADMVRKLSQGNPRLFIKLMHALFDKARKTFLSPKEQHRVLMQFASETCAATRYLQAQGPIIGSKLDKIAQKLHDRVHGEHIYSFGDSFSFSFKDESEFENNRTWIQLAIAHSRIIVDDKIKKTKVGKDTIYLLSNFYAAQYWLPMRKGDVVRLRIEDISDNQNEETRIKVFTKVKFVEQNCEQLSLFDNKDPED